MTDLITATIKNQVMLEGLKTHEVVQFSKFLKEMDVALKKQLSAVQIGLLTRTRLEKLLVAVDNTLTELFGGYNSHLATVLTELAQYQSEFEAKSLEAAIKQSKLPFEVVIPAAAQVKAAIFSNPLDAAGGKLLEPFIQDWSQSEVDRVTGAIRQGYFQGKTTNEILQIVRGTRANKFSDGILAILNRDAESIVRTAIQHASSVSRLQTLQDNADIVDKYEIVATLDGRTSQTCRSLDGKKFAFGKGPIPPFHIRCRTTFIAVLNDAFSVLSTGRTRSSIDGQVDAKQTYYDWLKTQDKAFQDHALGKARADLFRNGGLSAQRFSELNLDKNFKPLSLDEMRKLEPLAFARAGL
jgi:SPP1 gp7 family putative phage head morphogenesis protein